MKNGVYIKTQHDASLVIHLLNSIG